MNAPSNETVKEDRYDLNRFLRAQAPVYENVLRELNEGKKASHWTWFIFPQFDGLGTSATAKFYAIKSVDEAKAYLSHPVLRERLVECCRTLLQSTAKSTGDIFGFPDDLKVQSSMTLFQSISEPDSVFSEVLRRYFRGQLDDETLELLKRNEGNGNL